MATTDRLIAEYQEKSGYSSMENIYISNLLNERIALVCSKHVRLLTSKLKALGVFFSVDNDSQDLATIYLTNGSNSK